MAQGLRVLAALSEDTCLIPSISTCGSSQPRASTVPGDLIPASGLCGHQRPHGAQAYRQNIH